MKIIENPKTKLESVDLIDDNGVLLRITPDSLLEIDYDSNYELTTLCFNHISNTTGTMMPKHKELSFTVKFLEHTLNFHFTGDKAVKIAESLYKLKGH